MAGGWLGDGAVTPSGTEAKAWERRMLALRMKQCGMMPTEVGRRLGVSPYLAKVWVEKAEAEIQTTLGPVHPDYRPISFNLFAELEAEWLGLQKRRIERSIQEKMRIEAAKRDIMQAIRTLQRYRVHIGKKTLDTARAAMAVR